MWTSPSETPLPKEAAFGNGRKTAEEGGLYRRGEKELVQKRLGRGLDE